MSSISQNIRYTQIRKRLVDVFYGLHETGGDEIYESVDKLTAALKGAGFKCTIIDSVEHAYSIDLPFIALLPEGDDEHWPDVADREELDHLMKDLTPTDFMDHDNKIIAIHY